MTPKEINNNIRRFMQKVKSERFASRPHLTDEDLDRVSNLNQCYPVGVQVWSGGAPRPEALESDNRFGHFE